MNTKTNARTKRALHERLDYCRKATRVASAVSIMQAVLAIVALTGLESWDEGNPTLALVLIVLSLVARAYEASKDHEILRLEAELLRR